MSKKVFFLLRSPEERDVLDGIRSTLGMAVGNHYSYAAVMDTEVQPFDDYNEENLEWIREMEGDVFTTVPSNAENNSLTAITIQELGQKLREADFIVPYGVQD